MKVTVIFTGAVQQQVQLQEQIFELPEGASFKDLMSKIGAQFGHLMNQQIWNFAKSCFKDGISVLGSDRIFTEEDSLLKDNETIMVVQSVAGG